MEKKDREAIDKELSDMDGALEEAIDDWKKLGEVRKRLDEYSKQYNLPEIGCSNKETDDEFENSLKKLKSEHYRVKDCIISALGVGAFSLSEGKGEDLVVSAGSDDSGENKEETQGLKKQDDVKKNDTIEPGSSVDLEREVSADVEGLKGGAGKSDDDEN